SATDTSVRGSRTSCRTPEGSKVDLIRPRKPRSIENFITFVPKPLVDGGVTGGPFRSCQTICTETCGSPSELCSSLHVTATCPLGTDHAPYLVALVASSLSKRLRRTASF